MGPKRYHSTHPAADGNASRNSRVRSHRTDGEAAHNVIHQTSSLLQVLYSMQLVTISCRQSAETSQAQWHRQGPPHDTVAGAEASCLTSERRLTAQMNTPSKAIISGRGSKHPGGVEGCRTFEAGVLWKCQTNSSDVTWRCLVRETAATCADVQTTQASARSQEISVAFHCRNLTSAFVVQILASSCSPGGFEFGPAGFPKLGISWDLGMNASTAPKASLFSLLSGCFDVLLPASSAPLLHKGSRR